MNYILLAKYANTNEGQKSNQITLGTCKYLPFSQPKVTINTESF